MPTLANQLEETTPISLLVRKATRLGVATLNQVIQLAAHRGCRHYAVDDSGAVIDPGPAVLSDEDLVLLLISGEYPYNPTAIRCAAQLMRAPSIQAERLAVRAMRQKSGRVLAHIARAGLAHDVEGIAFWNTLLNAMPSMDFRAEPALPHWSRFVSMPGRQRGKMVPAQWLTPRP